MLAETAVILAGGKSSRMGFDKQCIELDGSFIIEGQIRMLRSIFNEVVVVTNKPKLYEGIDCILTIDELENFGPLGGIHAGLKAAKSRFCYFIACDMPFINRDYVLFMNSIINSRGFDSQVVITRFGSWLEPFNAFYSKNIIPVIEQAYIDKNNRISDVIANIKSYYIEESEARRFSPDWGMFANINTLEDLGKLKEDINGKKNTFS